MAEKFAGPDFHAACLEQRFVRTVETLTGRLDKSI
jgi:hypothetical protein